MICMGQNGNPAIETSLFKQHPLLRTHLSSHLLSDSLLLFFFISSDNIFSGLFGDWLASYSQPSSAEICAIQ